MNAKFKTVSGFFGGPTIAVQEDGTPLLSMDSIVWWVDNEENAHKRAEWKRAYDLWASGNKVESP